MRVRVSPVLARRVGLPLLLTLCRSWRIEVVGGEHWDAVAGSGLAPVCLLWHEAMLPLVWHHRQKRFAYMSSPGRDGQMSGEFGARLGYEVIWGSTSRGGVRALVGAIRAIRRGQGVGITGDGPRGPRRILKPGAVAAAQRGGGLLLPMHAGASPAYRLGSWDQMLVPLPFSKVRVHYGAPIAVGEGSEGVDAATKQVELAMASLVREVEWRSGAATDTA